MGADSSDPFAALAEAAHAIPATLSAPVLARLRVYVDTLLLWRQRLSLTAAATPRAIALDHILDSLYLAPLLEPGFRVADIGSGAGFPGIPLAIVYPEVHLLLIESRRKKANFLREVVRKTRLKNVVVAEERAEDLRAERGRSCDVVVSRALGPVGELLTLALPLLGPDGRAIAMKGPKGRGELLEHPDFASAGVIEYRLPSGARHLLLVYRRR